MRNKEKKTARASSWISVKQKLPAEWRKVDLWLNIPAGPASFGVADSFRVTDAWLQDGKWVHYYRETIAEILKIYVTHWQPISAPLRESDK